MKTVQSIAMAASIILVSSVSIANAAVYSAGSGQEITKALSVGSAPTKQAAYQLGLKKIAQLQTLSSQNLSLALSAIGKIQGSTLHLNGGSYITVQERMDTAGSIGYVGIVNASYHYLKESDSDNN